MTVFALRKAAYVTFPFYRKIVQDEAYSAEWAKAVRTGDLNQLLKLFQLAVGKVNLLAFSTNAIGYFIDLPVPKPLESVTNATSIRPGQVQFTFSSAVHRAVARAILPLYREIAVNRGYAALIVKAIRSNNQPFLEQLIRSKVKTSRLVKVELNNGFFLGFKFPGSRYVYYNQIFHERFV
ncbi:hypothetical protein SY83_04650 [Paenibacillus swuensis]|uniref:Uncharacterized protein n=1 Tax=Paenibacillus swuensis TaxID=1178515 RepID=A0A172TNR4_9BACL|nr:hypothetical protein SY83_04650 [Paenibacillus swuensis]